MKTRRICLRSAEDGCGGLGYLENTEDRIERCDMCLTFGTDEAAFQEWCIKEFLPLFEKWRVAKRTKEGFAAIDVLIIEKYRTYRNTNRYLNITERAEWWKQRRAEMEEFERRMPPIDNANIEEPVLPAATLVDLQGAVFDGDVPVVPPKK